MLYVFLVDTGTTLTFDMNLALETVANLKEVVYKASKIAPDKQVLLISGGQSLDPSYRVCSYSAGTDTNPIFLFCKSTIDSAVPPSPSMDFGSAHDLRQKAEACLNDKETTYQTVVTRAQLAQQLHETAREITRVCEQLVHDQHMQQQGWSAVVANLEDVVADFKGRTQLFEQTYQHYLNSREENLDILSHFGEDLSALADIPVLPCLLNQPQEMQLLDWVHSTDDEDTNLNVVADSCMKALEQMDHQLLQALEKHIESALFAAERPEMKEIGGLGERLYGLEQLLVEARKKVQEQGDIAQALLQNQQRARNFNDASVLPELCTSHRHQLKVMLKNDEKLRDIRSRCSRAKEELSTNLHSRLRWMMFVQRQLNEVYERLNLQNENLRRLRRHFDLLRQLHQAPNVYLRSMVEIVRRKHFSTKFIEWAETLSGYARIVHQDEASLRKSFIETCDGHFLTQLFPGIVEQFSPSFATSPPSPFDTNLPPVSVDDLERLKNALPTLWARLQLPGNLKEVLRNPPVLERLHSSAQKLLTPTELQIETGVLPSLSAALLSPPVRSGRSKVKRSQSDFHPDYQAEDSSDSNRQCRDDAGVELQRQLEETVKGQRCRLLALQSHLQCALEAGQAALPAFRTEMDSIRKLTIEWSDVANEQLAWLRSELTQQITKLFASEENASLAMLDEVRCHNKKLGEEKEKLQEELMAARFELDNWKKQCVEWEEEKKSLIASSQRRLQQREEELEQQRLEQLHQQKLEYKKQIQTLEKAVKVTEEKYQVVVSDWQSASEQENPNALRAWKQELMLGHEVELEQLKLEKDSELNGLLQLHNQMSVPDVSEWRKKYEQLLKDSETKKLQIQEECQRKHRLEIEGLRSRFRMMASQSPSDCRSRSDSLDKFEMRTTPPASPSNLVNAKRVPESHADELLLPLVEKLKQEKDKLATLVESYTTHYKTSNTKPTKWEATLSEALKDSNKMMQSVGSKVDQLRQESTHLSSKPPLPFTTSISQISSTNMAASVAVLQSDEKSSASPLLPPKSSLKKKPMSKMTRSLVRQGSANVYGCEVGDAVVVQWDERYSTHILYNKGPYLHFLHADSISALGLQNATMEPFLARVIQREFCLVRKEENRYNLPKGTNFYRVKVDRVNNAA
ncbi:LOW QUALITY PROTEIN: RB1-inducible coiled-coil protein 1-like [Daphnia carinata]|uniref:LOW QUALITY PROTEIN: RB1-inducible coiled-coil protein 1-like n=1 Tax=Daphnia carinata TaxID=120202 RepID=UPI00257BF906|nr:LOW QUALITY PROTEIN: RB1-inducible coiled-coil protein 1-like [Daphnia carinata]